MDPRLSPGRTSMASTQVSASMVRRWCREGVMAAKGRGRTWEIDENRLVGLALSRRARWHVRRCASRRTVS